MTSNLKQRIIRFLHPSIYSLWIIAVSALLVIFLFLAFFFEAWQSSAFLGEIFSSLSGAAVVAIITLLLLEGQTRSEKELQQNSAIFRKKLEIYQEFLNSLNQIVVNKQLSDNDKINMQFQVAYISIHTQSKRLKIISEQVNNIIHKLELKNPINGNIYTELYRLAVEFHNELYNDNREAGTADLQSALENFSCLGVTKTNNRTYKKLLWLEDSISFYPVKTRIMGSKDLLITANITSTVKSAHTLSSSQMNIVVHLENNMSGSIYLYTDLQTKESLMEILTNKTLWQYNKDMTYENAILDTHYIPDVAVVCTFDSETSSEKHLNCLYDTLAMMHKIWWSNNMKILRRNTASDGNEIQALISFQKENGDSGTVIDNNLHNGVKIQ